MRAEILIWSSISGAVLGVFAGAGAIAIGVLLAAAVPPAAARVLEPFLPLLLVIGIVGFPAAGALLGFLEGRLKLQ